ncbi:Conserved_hypothetical protein [Hexamita inflata]|uniref:Uncharacterized protein n=1 Tax=Hexamita inflata TaxID=28002 RepID=A0AA86RFJ8_9EUKA|nr:Conserved hypothetical protein [Hexamita inflata]
MNLDEALDEIYNLTGRVASLEAKIRKLQRQNNCFRMKQDILRDELKELRNQNLELRKLESLIDWSKIESDELLNLILRRLKQCKRTERKVQYSEQEYNYWVIRYILSKKTYDLDMKQFDAPCLTQVSAKRTELLRKEFGDFDFIGVDYKDCGERAMKYRHRHTDSMKQISGTLLTDACFFNRKVVVNAEGNKQNVIEFQYDDGTKEVKPINSGFKTQEGPDIEVWNDNDEKLADQNRKGVTVLYPFDKQWMEEVIVTLAQILHLIAEHKQINMYSVGSYSAENFFSFLRICSQGDNSAAKAEELIKSRELLTLLLYKTDLQLQSTKVSRKKTQVLKHQRTLCKIEQTRINYVSWCMISMICPEFCTNKIVNSRSVQKNKETILNYIRENYIDENIVEKFWATNEERIVVGEYTSASTAQGRNLRQILNSVKNDEKSKNKK